MIPPRLKYYIERIALKCEFLDLVRLRRDRGDLVCVGYYFLLIVSLIICSLSIYGLQQPQSDVYSANNEKLQKASNDFQSKAGILSLDLRGKVYADLNENDLATAGFSLVSSNGGDQRSKHSFETSYFAMKPGEELRKFFGDFKVTTKDAFSQTEKSDNKKLILAKKKCLTLQYKHAGGKENWKNFTQEFCDKSEIYSKQKATRGVRFNLYKFEPQIFRNTHCATSQSCKKFCQDKDMLYSENNFINDKLKDNVTTCYKPFVAKEICAVVEKASGKEDYGVVEGCFNGEVELYQRMELNRSWFFHNMTKFTVRDKNDPYLLAISLSGDPDNPWEIGATENRSHLKLLLFVGGIILLGLMLATAYVIFKRRHIKMLSYDADEGFNELESSTIKL